MNEQKEPQNTPIGLTDDELDQVSGGRGNNKPGSPLTMYYAVYICYRLECKNREVARKTKIVCQDCPHADYSDI